MLIAGLPFEGGDEALRRYMELGIGNFVLPGAFLCELPRLGELVRIGNELARTSGKPAPFFAMGGGLEAALIPPELGFLPSPLAIGALPSGAARSAARKAGRFLGSVLALFGIRLVFAPRLDVASDPKREGGILSLFGEDALRTGLLGAAYAEGLRSKGVAACSGLFPGCGCLSAEGRGTLPIVSFPADRLVAVEMKAFARCVRARVPAISIGRVLVPALEPSKAPAARSARVIEGRLREGLGFSGLVIGDRLDEDPAGPGRAAVLGALAGCDLSFVAGPAAAEAAVEALALALASGELPEPRVVVASRRLDHVSRTAAKRALAVAAEGASPASEQALRLLEGKALRRYSSRTIAASMTLLRNEGGYPLPQARRLVVFFEAPKGSLDSRASDEIFAILSAGLGEALMLRVSADPSPADIDAVSAALGDKKETLAALVLSYDAHFRPAQEGLVRLIEESSVSLSIAAMRDPYDAAFFPRAAGLLAAYGYSPETARAVVSLARSGGALKGRSPVTVLGLEV